MTWRGTSLKGRHEESRGRCQEGLRRLTACSCASSEFDLSGDAARGHASAAAARAAGCVHDDDIGCAALLQVNAEAAVMAERPGILAEFTRAAICIILRFAATSASASPRNGIPALPGAASAAASADVWSGLLRFLLCRRTSARRDVHSNHNQMIGGGGGGGRCIGAEATTHPATRLPYWSPMSNRCTHSSCSVCRANGIECG